MEAEHHSPSPTLVRAARVAEEFGISRVTLWRWERDGLLPRAHRINNQKYFPRAALDELRAAAERPGGTSSHKPQRSLMIPSSG